MHCRSAVLLHEEGPDRISAGQGPDIGLRNLVGDRGFAPPTAEDAQCRPPFFEVTGERNSESNLLSSWAPRRGCLGWMLSWI